MSQKQIQIKSQKEDNSQFSPISILTPFNDNWKIKARVLTKSEVINYESKKRQSRSGKLFTINIIDSSQSSIACTFFDQQVTDYYDEIQIGKVYEFQNGSVRINQNKYSNNDYSIIFDSRLKIFEHQDDTEIDSKRKVLYTKIQQIINKPASTVVDVIGLVQEISPVSKVQLKNGESKNKRDVIIYDDSKHSIQFTLWDKNAELQIQQDKPVSILNAMIQEYKDNKSLILSKNSEISFDQSNDDAQELIRWKTVNQISSSDIIQQIKGVNQSTGNKRSQYKNIEQIEQDCQKLFSGETEKIYSDLSGYIITMNQQGLLFYMYCETCQKKVNIYQQKLAEDNDGYKCEYCQKSFSQPNAKYLINVKIADHTGDLYASAYNDIGTQILNCEANHLRDLKKQNKETEINQLIQSSYFNQYKFVLLSQINLYQGEKKLRHQIIKMNKINCLSEIRELENQIQQYI